MSNIGKLRMANPKLQVLVLFLAILASVFLRYSYIAEKKEILQRTKEMMIANEYNNKAEDINNLFNLIYLNTRTVSLLPSVRGIKGGNRTSENEDIVSDGRFSEEGLSTVQQIYNILSAIGASEIYAIVDGFNPAKGEIPFFMFDSLIIGGGLHINSEQAALPSDFPEELEDEEYLYYVKQLEYYRLRYPTFEFASLETIPIIGSPPLRTCDNTQFLSKSRGDPVNTVGLLYSVPFYNMHGKFRGIISTIFRLNVLEAMLLDVPFLIVTERDKKAASKIGFEMPQKMGNFFLINEKRNIYVGDRRAPYFLERAKEVFKTGQIDKDEFYYRSLDVNDDTEWNLLYKYNKETLDDSVAKEKNIHILETAIVIIIALLFLYGIQHATVTEKLLAEVKRESNGRKAALLRAEDVLNIISKPPSLIPFFVTSSIYRLVRSIGGGDTIRWLDFKSEYAGIYLHDVSGHDIQEILLNILATSIVDDHKANPRIKSISMPSLFLTDMNERLCKFCDGTPQYITAIYMLINFHMREIHLSLAGHPKPWLINSDGTAEQIGNNGLVLGQFEISQESNKRYEDITVRLTKGQMLLLYSDGLMEQTNGQGMLFERKFREKIVPRLEGVDPESAYEILKAEFEAHLDGKQPDDDVSFVFIGSRPEDMYESFEFVPDRQLMKILENRRLRVGKPQTNAALNAYPKPNDRTEKRGVRTISDVSEAYESITKKLLENGWSQKKIGHVKIALDEIIVNAIMHGNLCSDQYIVNVSHILHRDILEVYVADEGEGFGSFNIAQRFTEEDLLKESGRGLFMASRYATKMYFNETGNKCWTIFTKS